jgi:hypothetical protein
MEYPRVRADGLTFRGRTDHGFLIGPKGLKGVVGDVSLRRDKVENPQAHGLIALKGFLDARVMPVKGWILADSADELAHMSRQLSGVGAHGGTFRVYVDHNGEKLYGDAQVSSLAAPDEFAGESVAEYQVIFEFPNPRLFGQTRSRIGNGPITNLGNFEATPLFKVEGSSPGGYSIGGPDGKVFTVSAAVTPGHPHYVDLETGYVRVDGQIVFGAVSRGDTWVVNGGGTVTHTLLAGTVTFTQTIRNTYA